MLSAASKRPLFQKLGHLLGKFCHNFLMCPGLARIPTTIVNSYLVFHAISFGLVTVHFDHLLGNYNLADLDDLCIT